jgi:hypothetical protein
LKCARKQFSIPGTPGAATPQVTCARECALIIVCATLRKPV